MCPCTPFTVSLPLRVPRRPFLIMSPVCCTDVGSPTIQNCGASPRAWSFSQTTTVPSSAGPSSSLVSKKAMPNAGLGWVARNSCTATTMAAREVFMSLAPRPNNLPSWWVGVKGSLSHWVNGPVGTTSVWPAKASVWPEVPARLAQRLRTRKVSGPESMNSQTNPRGFKASAIRSRQPASSGVTEGREISCSAKRRVSWQVVAFMAQSLFGWACTKRAMRSAASRHSAVSATRAMRMRP